MLIRLREYERIPIERVGKNAVRALRQLDEAWAGGEETAFDYSRTGYLCAKHYVGVVQVGNATIEVLPKAPKDVATASRNVVTMLRAAGELPLLERDMAALGREPLPLFEVLIRWFAKDLLRELRRGPARTYVRHEETSGFVRGKLRLSDQIRKNFAHPERVEISFDEMSVDTPLNRTLKYATSLLSRAASTIKSQTLLREIRFVLADVSDVAVTKLQARSVKTTRQDDRFGRALAFARMVIEGYSPTPRAGRTDSLTLLVSMHKLFEEYVGQLIKDRAPLLGIARSDVHLQAKGSKRYLVKKEGGGKLYGLKPDVLIEGDFGASLILDTKWKRLEGSGDAERRPSEKDMYQLYAYAKRYECSRCVLLYPRVPGNAPQRYTLAEDPDTAIEVAFLDMERDLWTERDAVWNDIATVIVGAGSSHQSAASS